MPTPPVNFTALLSRSTLTDLAAEEAVALVGATIDAAWVGKDLYEDTPEFRAVMDPDAERLNHVRNHLEHKHLRVHDSMWSGVEPGAAADGLTESIYKDDFVDMTLRLLALSRAALMYLSLGVHAEERARAAARPANAITPPMPLDIWEDDWKR